MHYNFDQIINRQNTNAMSVEGYEGYLFAGEDRLDIKHEKEDLIRMWVADMEFTVAPEIIEALKKRLEHPIFGYSGVFEESYLLAFQNWCKTRYDWSFDKDHLVYSQGVIPALFELVGYLCQPSEKILFLTPSYAFFKHAADYNKVELLTSDLVYENGDYQIDFEDFKKKAARADVSLFILCNPHNPTGKIWSDNELKQLGEICLENEVTIIADEIHCDLLRQGKSFTPLAKLFPQSDQIITCMAPSKTFNLAGFMFANILIPDEKLRTYWQERNLPVVNPLSVVAAEAAYAKGTPWLEAMTTYLDDNFAYLDHFLKTHLPKAKFQIPDATYLAWVDLSAYFPRGENLTLFFANQAGVILEGGNMFVDNADGFIRLNLACPRTKLEEGLKRIAMSVSI
ncbi:MAG: MalY/PatB family protein [Bacteroidota bacterium]